MVKFVEMLGGHLTADGPDHNLIAQEHKGLRVNIVMASGSEIFGKIGYADPNVVVIERDNDIVKVRQYDIEQFQLRYDDANEFLG